MNKRVRKNPTNLGSDEIFQKLEFVDIERLFPFDLCLIYRYWKPKETLLKSSRLTLQ